MQKFYYCIEKLLACHHDISQLVCGQETVNDSSARHSQFCVHRQVVSQTRTTNSAAQLLAGSLAFFATVSGSVALVITGISRGCQHQQQQQHTLLAHQSHQSLFRAIALQEKKGTYLPLHTVHTYTHTFNGPFSGTTRVSQYQKCKTNLDFTEARDNEWQWHRLGHIQACTTLQTANHASTPSLSLFQVRCPSCHRTNTVKALKANTLYL